ncbi:MAG: UvrD-helicase domain-containing protein [Candidatus Nanohalobium sp.]
MAEFSRPVSDSELEGLELDSCEKGFLEGLLPFSGLFSSGGGRSEDFLVEKMNELEEAFQRFESEVDRAVGCDSYLSSQRLRVLEERAVEVRELLDLLGSKSFEASVDGFLVQRFEEIRSGFREDLNLFEGYNEAFVDRELERFAHLFERGEYSLNEEQRRAVVRDDDFNRVVAGAGAGKTLVLIYRIAYLVEKGVRPDDIVALTLTRQARTEMEERLEQVFGIEGVEFRTFHSLGYRFGKEEDEDVIDPEERRYFVEDELKDLKPGDDLARHLNDFLYFRDSEVVSPEDFESRKEFVEAREKRRYRTLDGEEVRSEAEKFIADFLFTHDIDYRYEEKAEWAETSEDRRGYSPDFYLPEHDVYIEHWGVDENGEVPDWFSWDTEKYRNKMEWARRQFRVKGKDLIETFDYEYRRNELEGSLIERLEGKRVEVERLTSEEIVEKVGEEDVLEELAERFSDFIENAKTFDKGPEEIRERLDPGRDRKKYHFGSAGRILLQKYEAWLEENNQVDYQDLIREAYRRFRSDPGRYGSMYEHVLVDEFQDVDMSQIELIDSLTGGDSANLFCVGDDWQSIYGFRGAVVDYFIDFEDFFGEATTTRLERNYRSRPPIVEAGNHLIDHNDRQVDKRLEAVRDGSQRPELHVIDDYTEASYFKNTGRKVVELVEKYVGSGSRPGYVMVLVRQEEGWLIDKVIEELREEDIPVGGDDGVELLTAHSSKGREAKHVVLLDASQGHGGFSPETRESKLVNIPRDIDVDTEAEERRLFYVAMTRAEDTLDILARKGEKSSFLDEIREDILVNSSIADPGEEDELVEIEARVEKLWESDSDKISQTGLLGDSTGAIRFVAWSSTAPPELEQGRRYSFADLMVVDNDGRKELHFRPQTRVREL